MLASATAGEGVFFESDVGAKPAITVSTGNAPIFTTLLVMLSATACVTKRQGAYLSRACDLFMSGTWLRLCGTILKTRTLRRQTPRPMALSGAAFSLTAQQCIVKCTRMLHVKAYFTHVRTFHLLYLASQCPSRKTNSAHYKANFIMRSLLNLSLNEGDVLKHAVATTMQAS